MDEKTYCIYSVPMEAGQIWFRVKFNSKVYGQGADAQELPSWQKMPKAKTERKLD